MKLQELLRRAPPKGGKGWVFLPFSTWIFVSCLPRLGGPKVLLMVVALFLPFFLLLMRRPARGFVLWDKVHFKIRMLSCAAFGYVAAVTIGNFHELYNFRLWWEFLIPLNQTPWSSINSASLLVGASAAATQYYWQEQSVPPDSSRELDKTGLISQAQAEREAQGLLKKPEEEERIRKQQELDAKGVAIKAKLSKKSSPYDPSNN